MRVARTIGAAVIGLALVLAAPWVGWWTLIGFAIVAVDFATLEPRLRRSPRPERIAAGSLLLALGIIGATVALSGGPESPLLPWLVIPAMTSATRFRREVVVALGALSVVVALAVTLPVDPDALADDPSPLIVTLALLAVVSVIAGALLHGEIQQRDLAVLDPLTGLLNRASLESRGAEIEQQALLTGAACRSCSATSTASSRSTTSTATSGATPCSATWPSRCAARCAASSWSTGSAARSFWCCSPAWP